MSRRRKPSPQGLHIWDQLDRFQEAYFAARREGREGRTEWERLYQYTIACQESASVDVDDVGAVLSWGWVMEMTAGNYCAATDILVPYFTHPQIEQAHPDLTTAWRCNLATGILYSGDEERAVDSYRPLLESEDKRTAQIAKLRIPGELREFFSERPASGRASVALRDLVEELVNRLKRRVPLKKRLPENATYAELLRLLDSTYPPSDQEALRAERESRS